MQEQGSRPGRTTFLVAGIALAALLWSACASGAPATPTKPAAAAGDWAAVEAAAKKEGNLVLYSITDPASMQAVGAAFNQTYPEITFEAVRMSPADALERMKAEAETGQPIVDVNLSGSNQVKFAVRDGLVVTEPLDLPILKDPASQWRYSPTMDPGIYWFQLLTYDFFVNTSLAPPGQEPRGWQDLADPKWKGKIAYYDPRRIGSGWFDLMAIVHDPQLGEPVARGVLENSVLFGDFLEASRKVINGELAVYPGASVPPSLFEEPLRAGRVKFVTPVEGKSVILSGLTVAKTAPHPNAARVFINWYLSPAGQATVAKINAPIRADMESDIEHKRLNGQRVMVAYPLSTQIELDESDRWLKYAADLVTQVGK
jgi:iron(III) transport system substrate-binding protein